MVKLRIVELDTWTVNIDPRWTSRAKDKLVTDYSS